MYVPREDKGDIWEAKGDVWDVSLGRLQMMYGTFQTGIWNRYIRSPNNFISHASLIFNIHLVDPNSSCSIYVFKRVHKQTVLHEIIHWRHIRKVCSN